MDVAKVSITERLNEHKPNDTLDVFVANTISLIVATKGRDYLRDSAVFASEIKNYITKHEDIYSLIINGAGAVTGFAAADKLQDFLETYIQKSNSYGGQ